MRLWGFQHGGYSCVVLVRACVGCRRPFAQSVIDHDHVHPAGYCARCSRSIRELVA